MNVGKRTVEITRVKGVASQVLPLAGKFVVRGFRQGHKATPAECAGCGEKIAVGEQYVWIADIERKFCLGCVEY